MWLARCHHHRFHKQTINWLLQLKTMIRRCVLLISNPQQLRRCRTSLIKLATLAVTVPAITVTTANGETPSKSNNNEGTRKRGCVSKTQTRQTSPWRHFEITLGTSDCNTKHLEPKSFIETHYFVDISGNRAWWLLQQLLNEHTMVSIGPGSLSLHDWWTRRPNPYN